MPTKNTIRRNYLIIRRILQNDYPSKRTLLDYMKRYDVEIGERTFQRDLADIRSNFDIEIIYDEQKNGYYAQTDSTFDFDKLLYFIGLAESSDIILSTVKDRNKLLEYLSISPTPHAKGVENIGRLLQAIQSQMSIHFEHRNYQTGRLKEYTVFPYLLKEFEGMWYMFAYVDELKAFRTFGLDRISDLIITDNHFQREKVLELTADKFNQVYGLIYEPDNNPNAPIEKVELRFSDTMLHYLKALPLHQSQTIDENIVTLHLIINPELENKIIKKETDYKIAYLTFDDGPYYSTNDFLKVLKENDVKATFFTIGLNKERCYDNQLKECHSLYKKIVLDGHTIANHTYSHQIFNGLYSSSTSFINQVVKQEEFIKEKTGVITNIVRFPGGASTAGNLKNDIIKGLREKKYGWVDWSAQDGDGGYLPNKDVAWNNFTNSINQNIEVVLFHDYNKITLSILPDAIKYLKDNNYILLPLFYESNMINK